MDTSLVVLDVDGCKYQFQVKNTHCSIKQAR